MWRSEISIQSDWTVQTFAGDCESLQGSADLISTIQHHSATLSPPWIIRLNHLNETAAQQSASTATNADPHVSCLLEWHCFPLDGSAMFSTSFVSLLPNSDISSWLGTYSSPAKYSSQTLRADRPWYRHAAVVWRAELLLHKLNGKNMIKKRWMCSAECSIQWACLGH